MIKAAFFDIDGTLLDHSGGKSEMPQSTLEALNSMRKKGIKLFVATGRHYLMLDDMFGLFPFDGFVTLNGQLVKDNKGNVLRRFPHEKEDIIKLIEIVKKEGFPCTILEEEKVIPVNDTPENRSFLMWMNKGLPPLYDISRLDEHPVLQFLAQMPLNEAKTRIPLPHVEATSAGGDLLDMIPVGGGKEVGIAAAAEHYGIKREEIVVFGDGINDVRMIKWAGLGVAMGNAADVTKQAADFVTTPVWDNGIMHAAKALSII